MPSSIACRAAKRCTVASALSCRAVCLAAWRLTCRSALRSRLRCDGDSGSRSTVYRLAGSSDWLPRSTVSLWICAKLDDSSGKRMDRKPVEWASLPSRRRSSPERNAEHLDGKVLEHLCAVEVLGVPLGAAR